MVIHRMLLLLMLAGACVMPATTATAGGGDEDSPRAKIDPAVLTDGFLAAHPDLRWRREGIEAHGKGRYGDALAYFRRAARHADKPSQAMVAGMYWDGQGVAQDRALAYAWMDLAAERQYPDFVLFRERYWNRMTEAERASALERGQAVYAEFGDAVAKPRLETILRREKRKITGSRLGYVGNLEIVPMTGPLAGSGMTLSGEQYYAKEYWEPQHYWQLQDDIWRAPRRERVNVGEVEQVRGEPPALAPDPVK